MRKVLWLVIALALTLGAVSCGSDKSNSSDNFTLTGSDS
jgi:hypothetical protein